MGEYDAPNRPLPYSLRFSLVNQRTTEGDTPSAYPSFIWPEDPEERTLVPFWLNQREWTVLGSTLDVGSDIAYGADAIRVMWLWMRNMREPVAICAAIIDCIENDEDTKRAVVDMLKTDPDFNEWFKENTYRITGPQITGKLVPGDCDDSVAAGRAIALVERLDTNNKDFLEVVEVGTNDEEKVGAILGAIPALQESGVGQVLDIIQDVLEDFSENYNAASTEARKDAMARDIYCLMLQNEDCSITFQQLFDYFQAKATSGLTIISTIFDVISFLADGDFDNDELVWFGLFALQAGFVLNSRDFYGINIGRIGSIMRDASPSSAWEDWDPCEDTWSKTWNFVTGDVEGWDIGNGDYIPSVGFQSPGTGTYPYTVDIGRDVTWPSGTQLKRAVIAATSTTADAEAFRGIYYPSGGGSPQIGYQSNTGNYTMSFDTNNTTPPRVEIQVSNTHVAGTNTIRIVTLQGTGAEPIWD